MSEENYEYLDHTADIQVHAWGNSLEEAFVNTSHAMINYMYERHSVVETFEKELKVEGNSLNMLLYNFLEEVLYIFFCDPYMAVKSVKIDSITKDVSDTFHLEASCRGEEYERRKHGSKTEIKAVTFSNMSINIIDCEDNRVKVDIYIIFDI